MYRLHVAPGEKTQAPTGPAPPPVWVPTLHDFHDVTSAEAELRWVLCREVKLGLGKAGPGWLWRSREQNSESVSGLWRQRAVFPQEPHGRRELLLGDMDHAY